MVCVWANRLGKGDLDQERWQNLTVDVSNVRCVLLRVHLTASASSGSSAPPTGARDQG